MWLRRQQCAFVVHMYQSRVFSRRDHSNTMHPVLQCVNFCNAQGMKAIKSNTRPPVGTRSKPEWFMRWQVAFFKVDHEIWVYICIQNVCVRTAKLSRASTWMNVVYYIPRTKNDGKKGLWMELTVLFNETTFIAYAKSLSTGGSRDCPLEPLPLPFLNIL